VSGVRKHFQSYWVCPDGKIHHLRHTLALPQLTSSGVFALELSATMFFSIHSIYVHIIAMGHIVSPLTLTPET
jgi:hypothetical protein